jgi:hypothetical protein
VISNGSHARQTRTGPSRATYWRHRRVSSKRNAIQYRLSP